MLFELSVWDENREKRCFSFVSSWLMGHSWQSIEIAWNSQLLSFFHFLSVAAVDNVVAVDAVVFFAAGDADDGVVVFDAVDVALLLLSLLLLIMLLPLLSLLLLICRCCLCCCCSSCCCFFAGSSCSCCFYCYCCFCCCRWISCSCCHCLCCSCCLTDVAAAFVTSLAAAAVVLVKAYFHGLFFHFFSFEDHNFFVYRTNLSRRKRRREINQVQDN